MPTSKRRATVSRGPAVTPKARNGTAPGLTGNGAVQGINQEDLARMQFTTCGIAMDPCGPSADAAPDCETLCKFAEGSKSLRAPCLIFASFAALSALGGTGCQFVVMAGKPHGLRAALAFVAATVGGVQ